MAENNIVSIHIEHSGGDKQKRHQRRVFQKGDIVRYNNPDFPEFNDSLGIVDDRPSTWTPIIWLAPTRTPNDTFDMGAKTEESPDVLELVMRGEPDAIR